MSTLFLYSQIFLIFHRLDIQNIRSLKSVILRQIRCFQQKFN